MSQCFGWLRFFRLSVIGRSNGQKVHMAGEKKRSARTYLIMLILKLMLILYKQASICYKDWSCGQAVGVGVGEISILCVSERGWLVCCVGTSILLIHSIFAHLSGVCDVREYRGPVKQRLHPRNALDYSFFLRQRTDGRMRRRGRIWKKKKIFVSTQAADWKGL